MSVDLRQRKVAVLGGDGRMVEVARLARAAGAEVSAFGTEESGDVSQSQTLAEALDGAHMVVCPVPGVAPDDALWAPNASSPVYLSVEALGRTAPDCVLFMGQVTPAIAAAAEEAGVTAIGHSSDDVEMLGHAIPTAEGAVRHAITMSDVTLMGSDSICVGFGRVGQSVAWVLRGLGANVTVCARNRSQRARATGFGLRSAPIESLPQVVRDADFVFQTASGNEGVVLTQDVLENVRDDVVIICLASPPAATDLEYCSTRNLRALWARGQAGSAPRTTGRNEWEVVTRLYARERGEALVEAR